MNSLQGIKRPRSESQSSKGRKKGSKKSKKGSSSAAGGGGGAGAGGGGGDDGAGSLESTATPEGRLLSLTLSTLSASELSRFEAFRRCTFRSDSVSSYVAHRLLENEERRYARRQGTKNVLGGRDVGVVPLSGLVRAGLDRCPYSVGSAAAAAPRSAAVGGGGGTTSEGESSAAAQLPSLRDLVPPLQTQEITVVVTALAKSYAQRLVTAARRLATAQGHPSDEPLRPHHVTEAARYRAMAGIDPGFFMQGATTAGGAASKSTGRGGLGSGMGMAGIFGGAESGGTAASCAALGVVDRNGLRRDAALKAQEEYDRCVEEEEKKLDEEKEKD